MLSTIRISIVLLAALVTGSSFASDVPVYTPGSSDVTMHERYYTCADPYPFVLSLEKFGPGWVQMLHGNVLGLSSDTRFNIAGWNVPTCKTYFPAVMDTTGNKYTESDTGRFLVELERPDSKEGPSYSGGLKGYALDKWPYTKPFANWVNNGYQSGFAPEFGMTHLYQTGDNRLLGCSTDNTVAKAGCYYKSIGMVVADFYGTDSVEYRHWSDMKWMCDNGAFSWDLIRSAKAAELLNMKYVGPMSASKANLEWVSARGWAAVVALKGHFMTWVRGIRIKSNGDVIYDYIMDPNKNRAQNPDVEPRFLTDPVYKNRVIAIRVFAPIFGGRAVSYRQTKLGWWKAETTSSSSNSSDESGTSVAYTPDESSDDYDLTGRDDLYGFASISATTNTEVYISKVVGPAFEVLDQNLSEKPGSPSLVRMTTCLSDPYPEEPPADSWYSEYAEPEAEPGIRKFYLTGQPQDSYSLLITGYDCNNQPVEKVLTGLLDEDGKAQVEYDFEPGSFDTGPERLTAIADVCKLNVGDQINLRTCCTVSDESGFCIQDVPYGAKGAWVNWPGGMVYENCMVDITGILSAISPEVVINAESVSLYDYSASPKHLMLTNSWSDELLPLCQLVRFHGKLVMDESQRIAIDNGRMRLYPECPIWYMLDGHIGENVTLSGVLRAGHRFCMGYYDDPIFDQ